MTDRHAGYLVVLAEDLRDDDAEEILTALRMVRGVQSVAPVVANIDQRIAQSRADTAWRERIYTMLEKSR
ncbi:hypothetical protein ACQP2Y_21025 [Actinoplanes sp. CA-051413]|uniref:hypothetical protein n=1 Tax=Actinoplanes sp. CA-051413 TaxID=3239899 RepID=UPI003D971E7D